MKKFIVETDGTESGIYTASVPSVRKDYDDLDDAIDAAKSLYYETKRDTRVVQVRYEIFNKMVTDSNTYDE